MYATRYLKVASLEAAQAALSQGDDPKLLAGGMTLLPTLKQRLAAPDLLIDLAACDLSHITDQGDSLRIGAMTTHADVASSDLVQQAIPALAELAGGIGDRQVRNRGTIGGSLANNDPAACYPAAILGLGGVVHTNQRDIAADDFFVDMFETALEEDEIICAVSCPKPQKSAYLKYPNPASRYAMVGVFVAQFEQDVRLAITGAGENGVFRLPEMEALLAAEFSAATLADQQVSEEGLMSDIHASADFRAHVISQMVGRAVNAAQIR